MCSGLQHPRRSRGVPANWPRRGTWSSCATTRVCGLSHEPAWEQTLHRNSPAKATWMLLPQIRSTGRFIASTHKAESGTGGIRNLLEPPQPPARPPGCGELAPSPFPAVVPAAHGVSFSPATSYFSKLLKGKPWVPAPPPRAPSQRAG